MSKWNLSFIQCVWFLKHDQNLSNVLLTMSFFLISLCSLDTILWLKLTSCFFKPNLTSIVFAHPQLLLSLRRHESLLLLGHRLLLHALADVRLLALQIGLFAEKRKILRLIVQSGFTKKQVVVKRAQKTLHLSTRNLWTR